jgi:hypothetical protein
MIRVNRGNAPEAFESRAAAWRARFAAYRQQTPDITASVVWGRVREEIGGDAGVLAARFHHKCAFCEARPGHVSHPHIEHYRPQGRPEFEARMFDWDNWLLSCGICNQEKWKHFPIEGGQPLLLNPAEEDPNPHLHFIGPRLRGVTKRGKKTVKLVKLDRSPLRKARNSWLTYVDCLLLLCVESSDRELVQECREHLIWTLQDDAPFTGMTRAYLGEKCPKLAKPAVTHPQVEERNRVERIRELVEERTAKLKHLA